MKRSHYFITNDHFRTLLSTLSKEADLYIPVKNKDYLSYRKFSPEYKGEYVVDQIRAAEPIKSFLTHPRERVDGARQDAKAHARKVLIGVKNCDIISLKIQDFVFIDSKPQDPFYAISRKDLTIISCDCNLLWETCFCVALDIDPYPREGFDINLSRGADGFIAEVGSDKGMRIIEKNKALFSDATDTLIKNRSTARELFKMSLKSRVREKETPERGSIIGSMKKSYNVDDIWTHFTSTCVECGGCNHCCPACHCFALTDEKKESIKARFRSWDACLYSRYARVAGGANPRQHLHERLRNRFDKKFEFFQNVMGIFGCTGCGRCIEVCPGKIDIREVLKRMVAVC